MSSSINFTPRDLGGIQPGVSVSSPVRASHKGAAQRSEAAKAPLSARPSQNQGSTPIAKGSAKEALTKLADKVKNSYQKASFCGKLGIVLGIATLAFAALAVFAAGVANPFTGGIVAAVLGFVAVGALVSTGVAVSARDAYKEVGNEGKKELKRKIGNEIKEVESSIKMAKLYQELGVKPMYGSPPDPNALKDLNAILASAEMAYKRSFA